MATARCVFHQENVPSGEAANLTVSHFDFDLPVQQDDELALWSGVPVVIVIRVVLPEDHTASCDRIREPTDLAAVPQGNINLLEVGLAPSTRGNSSHSHG